MKQLLNWASFWILFLISLGLLAGVGWVKNIIWLFSQHDLVHVALGIIGVVVAPIGMIHGWLC